ncbi:MAG: hypothetical protein M3322_12145 [Actinomycetota bacterium]|nr:hypothetical protein [Actinomycetota bacterium]
MTTRRKEAAAILRRVVDALALPRPSAAGYPRGYADGLEQRRARKRR